MILFKFKEKPDLRGPPYQLAHRWIIETEGWKTEDNKIYSIYLTLYYKSRETGNWHGIHSEMWGFAIHKKWRWGSEHLYYDGPHCSLSLGFLTINWSGNPFTHWCKKCAGE